MQLIPVHTVSHLDLDTVHNPTILCTARVACRHGIPKLFIADDSSNIKAFAVANDNSGISQLGEWTLPTPTEQIYVCQTECCMVFARTRDGGVWRIRVTCEPYEHVSKRPRIQDCEQIYKHHDYLVPIHSSPTGLFYGLNADGAICHCKQSDLGMPSVVGMHKARSCVTTSILVDPTQLSEPFLMHLGLPKDCLTLLFGHENGDLTGSTVQGQEIQFAALPEEPISAIYLLHLINDAVYDAMVVLGRYGTVQLYLETSDGRLIFKEFLIPAPVLASCSVFERSLLVSLKNQVHFIEFTYSSQQEPDNIVLKSTRLNTLQDITHIHDIHHEASTYQLLLVKDNSQLIQASCDFGARIEAKQDSELLEQTISNILDELSDYEKAKKEMDSHVELLNERLIAMNRIIYGLQRIKGQKTRLQLEKDDDSSPFQCDLQPIIVPDSRRLFMKSAACLRLRIRALIPMDWSQWSLHVNMCHQRTSLRQVTTPCTQEQDSVDGTTLIVPLAGLTDHHVWEQDIPVDIASLRLPLSVSMHLSTHLNLSIPPIHNAHESSQADSQSNREMTKQFTFPLSDFDLDDLHFISPCTDDALKMLKRSGVPGATARLCEQQAIRKTLDNSNQYPLARLEGPSFDKLTMDKYESASLRFLVKPRNDSTVDETCNHILETFLSEARSRNELDKILDTPHQAFFTLLSYPEYPVSLRLSRDSSSPISITIHIHCLNPVVMLKVESSLLARSREFMVDNEDTDALLDQAQHAFVIAAQDLEEKFRVGYPQHEFWNSLKTTMIQLRKIYSNAILGTLCL
ncbi:hypothetical protein O0I10_012320 [Lichtheimia ornata]|uniref:Uncharacterized protein n=1 Tax=Lichtheimia ornata TaxID=688661 RepID=A0AAD7URA1_9FUNG|nr:uncharacterized protein O0I10_012320 [Lichtheimia ornata]KAJ8652089.1 hypothetical protein O0I10_012320 [Lichtheimia ornata]